MRKPGTLPGRDGYCILSPTLLHRHESTAPDPRRIHFNVSTVDWSSLAAVATVYLGMATRKLAKETSALGVDA